MVHLVCDSCDLFLKNGSESRRSYTSDFKQRYLFLSPSIVVSELQHLQVGVLKSTVCMRALPYRPATMVGSLVASLLVTPAGLCVRACSEAFLVAIKKRATYLGRL